jgi:hypothetical protein
MTKLSVIKTGDKVSWPDTKYFGEFSSVKFYGTVVEVKDTSVVIKVGSKKRVIKLSNLTVVN